MIRRYYFETPLTLSRYADDPSGLYGESVDEPQAEEPEPTEAEIDEAMNRLRATLANKE